MDSTPTKPLRFDPLTAPPNSTWVPPKWITGLTNGVHIPTHNGLGAPWDPKNPSINGVDLTKPDPRLKTPDIQIQIKDERSSSTPHIAFKNVTILDSTGAPPYSGDVLVNGQRIAKVGGKLTSEELAGARIIEGRGRTLMSGLIDAHTHFSWTDSSSLEGLADMPVEEHTLFTARSALTFLDCGYTMCLGAASAKDRLDVVIKNAIHNGDIPGPRFLANGKEMAPTTGALIPGITKYVETPKDIKRAIDELADLGVDQCKLSMSGDEITEELRSEDTTFPDELVAAGVEAAHARGMRVCSHARSDESILQCLQYGVDIIYHASFISESTMDALEAQKDRVYVAPALNFPLSTLTDAAAFGYPVSRAEAIGYAREMEIAIAGLKEMHRRGIKILPGGDYGFAWTPHGTYRDLEHFVKLLEMTPMEAILSATALGGELMLHPHELGKVVPGAYADLILVNGDPLQDISLLSHKENLDVILMNGRVHKGECELSDGAAQS
ncbi:amidohydrolase [Favolaschia claudopus]|uniref:Amidohydrolase n=1 Tax=Favolaschia claudopus TaxID=2862362 RepID=A0AAW0DL96_9AGAR